MHSHQNINVYEEEAVKLHAFLSSASVQLHAPVGLPEPEWLLYFT